MKNVIISPSLCSALKCDFPKGVNALTTNEIIIVAVAAAVFIIVIIIMWSIILKKKRKARENTSASAEPFTELPDGVPDSAAALGFKLIENTVIVHTDDRLNDG